MNTSNNRRSTDGETRQGEPPMSAALKLNPSRPIYSPFPRIATPKPAISDPSAHRIISPVRTQPAEPPPVAEVSADAVDLMAFSQLVSGQQTVRVIPEAGRERYRMMTLRQFYDDTDFGLRSVREKAVAARATAAGTFEKDGTAVSMWERYCGRPPSIAMGDKFGGCLLGMITDEYATAFIESAMTHKSHDYVRGCWNHLRWMFNEAVRLQVLEAAPQITRWPKKVTSGTDDLTTIYQQPGESICETLQSVNDAMAANPDLQDAFQFANATGMRPVDWSLVRWEQLRLECDRPLVSFQARKTQKQQTVPLARCTVRMLERRRKQLLTYSPDALVFRGLTNPTAKHPEKSRPARRRTLALKIALAGIGLDPEKQFKKPWQICRATTNERLERYQPGAGQFVLGHCSTLNSRSYREPSGMVFDAVSHLEQPECWKV